MKEIVKLDYDETDVSDPDKMTILPHNWKEDTALMLTVTDRVCKGIEKARKLLAALLNIYPWDALPAIDDSDIARLWKAVNEKELGDWCTYDVTEINQYLEQRFCQPVAKASHAQIFPLPIE